MDFVKFITMLAWIFGSLSGLLVLARIIGFMSYTEIDKAVDALKGYRWEFPVTTPGIIFIEALLMVNVVSLIE